MTEDIRTFDTGATRDTAQGKLDYVRALSPVVLQRYVQYLDAHRLQPNGKMRDFDNWKKGIPIDVYFSGLGRHFMAVWLLAQGFLAKDNHGPATLEDSLAAIIFNASGWLHEIIKSKPETVPGYGGDVAPVDERACATCKYLHASISCPPCSDCARLHQNWEAIQ